MTLTPMQSTILRILADGPLGDMSLIERLPANRPEVRRLAVDRVHAAGLIKRSGRAWHLTGKGRAQLAQPVQTEIRPYVPPKMPPRRPGADHSHIRSHYGSMSDGAR